MRKILIDTNILVRFFIGDVKDQTEKARQVFVKIENNKLKGEISLLVINELIWILENYYNLKRDVYLPQVLKLLALKNIKISEVRKSLVIKTLKGMLKHNLDFTDLYLLEIKNDKELFTFDRKLKNLSEKEK